MEKDTIAAIASAMSNGGIGVLRISGPDALTIADQVFRGNIKLKDAKANTIHYGFICQEDEKVDEVEALVFRAPHSYTTEDVVEFDCHGGSFLLKKVLELVLLAGARLAEPGEFTKRAFLGGRIDLSQAESVMDLIASSNEFARKTSMNQLQGNLSLKIRDLREKILNEVAFIEAALDDPEHYDLDGYENRILNVVTCLSDELSHLIKTADFGQQMKNGIPTAIIGKPNAGKSSLLNALMRKERAIVTEIAGTTRDTIEEQVNIRGITLNLMDTAGIRQTGDKIEQLGVERSREAFEDASLVLYVLDSSLPLDQEDLSYLAQLKNKKSIIVCNKTDLKSVLSADELLQYSPVVVFLSLLDGSGLDLLEDQIYELFLSGRISEENELVITNLRHKEALQNAFASLQKVKEAVEDGMPEDIYTVDLMDAYAFLGSIIGESVEEDLVNRIFAKFCMGK